MKILGGVLMLVGALYWQVPWMPVLFAGGLIVLILGVERSILHKLRAVRKHQQDQATHAEIERHHKEHAEGDQE